MANISTKFHENPLRTFEMLWNMLKTALSLTVNKSLKYPKTIIQNHTSSSLCHEQYCFQMSSKFISNFWELFAKMWETALPCNVSKPLKEPMDVLLDLDHQQSHWTFPCAMTNISWRIHENPLRTFWVVSDYVENCPIPQYEQILDKILDQHLDFYHHQNHTSSFLCHGQYYFQISLKSDHNLCKNVGSCHSQYQQVLERIGSTSGFGSSTKITELLTCTITNIL